MNVNIMMYISAISRKTARLLDKWDAEHVAERLLGTGGKLKNKKSHEIEPSYGVLMGCCCNLDTVPIVGERFPLELLDNIVSALAKKSMIVGVKVEDVKFDEDNGWYVTCTSPSFTMVTYERYRLVTDELLEGGWHVMKVNDMPLGTTELENHWPGKD
jgi:hypothetical protein